MTPPESPRDRDGASVASVDMSGDISGSDQKHREQGQGRANINIQKMNQMNNNWIFII